MKKKRIIRIISFLIMTLLIFQFIPSTLKCSNGFDSHTQSSKVFLPSVSIHTDILFIGRRSQNTLDQKVHLKSVPIYVSQISFEDISNVNLSYQAMPFDYRKVIRQSIPHYFNGSKYKNNHFPI